VAIRAGLPDGRQDMMSANATQAQTVMQHIHSRARQVLLSEAGNFADVYDLGDGTILKAFLTLHAPGRPATYWEHQDLVTRRVFRAEAEAYEKLQAHAEIEPFLPRYFGRVDPTALNLSGGRRGPYLQGCGILLERLSGKEMKIGCLPHTLLAEADKLIDKMAEVLGRMELTDASCFVPGSRRDFTVVDFGLWNRYSEVRHQLAIEGSLSQAAINIYSLS
jgi:hypothetical protein